MEIVKASIKDLEAMNNLWNEVVNEEGFYKPFTYPEYQEKMLANPEFSFDKVLLAKENDELKGFCSSNTICIGQTIFNRLY